MHSTREPVRGSGCGWAPRWLAIAVLLVGLALPRGADAACCVCGTCAGAAFCVDGVPSAASCAQFCVAVGCGSASHDGADACAGGCGAAPVAPTATVPTATRTPLPSHTPTVTATLPPALGGALRYFTGSRPVGGATLILSGATAGATASEANGSYAFALAGPGDVIVRPEKRGDFRGAVTAFDAVQVLEAVAGLRTLTADQRLAADVSGNGALSALDAVHILELQAGLLTRLPAATLCASDWLFVPAAAPLASQTLVAPLLGTGTCRPGRIELNNLRAPLGNRSFRAILLGDVSGNWAP